MHYTRLAFKAALFFLRPLKLEKGLQNKWRDFLVALHSTWHSQTLCSTGKDSLASGVKYLSVATGCGVAHCYQHTCLPSASLCPGFPVPSCLASALHAVYYLISPSKTATTASFSRLSLKKEKQKTKHIWSMYATRYSQHNYSTFESL